MDALLSWPGVQRVKRAAGYWCICGLLLLGGHIGVDWNGGGLTAGVLRKISFFFLRHRGRLRVSLNHHQHHRHRAS
jgi:hypothetical protein